MSSTETQSRGNEAKHIKLPRKRKTTNSLTCTHYATLVANFLYSTLDVLKTLVICTSPVNQKQKQQLFAPNPLLKGFKDTNLGLLVLRSKT